MLSLCIDNVTQPPSAFGGGEAVTMATKPQISGVEVSKIVGWSPDTDNADSERAAQLFSSNHTICSDRAAALVALLADSLPNSPHMHVGSFTPTRSTTHSRSAPSPSTSTSLPLTFSARSTVTVSASQSRVTATPSLRVGPFAIFSVSTTTTASETESQTTSLRAPFRSEPPTTMNNTITPPPQKRTVRITTSVLLPNNEAAATVVLSTAGASGAVASTLGSGGAGVVVIAGSSVRMMECGLAEDDPQPARFELAISLQRRGSSGDGVVANEAWVLKTVEVCLWLISLLGFVQLGVQGYWAYHVHQRRRHQEDVEESSSNSSSTSSENEEVDDQKAQPLLVPVEMRDLAAQKKLARVTTVDDDKVDDDSASDEAYDNPLLDKEEPP